MDRVGREEFVVLVAVPQIGVVAFEVSGRVGLLDRSSRRSIITCDGEPQCRPVGIRDLLLHQSLSEGAAADDRSPVVVLQRSGKNLTR